MQSKETTHRQEKHGGKKNQATCMDIIKRMNGFKESVWKDLDKIDTIELVLEDFGSMAMFYRFKGLKSLTLINVGINTIEGLSQCLKLQELWLNENNISKIEGLDKNVNLRSLYLSHNNIKKLEGLATLSKLKTFWICDNNIETLQNLEGLVSLQQLWIASNQIEYIKTSLDSLSQLKDLNISGNKICSFKQVLNLNRLPNLEMLSLYDPHFGQNPICTLSNYQTYMLYHLRRISKLDTLSLSDQAKIFAENTYMRKKMYYNMKIKTIERHFSTLSKLVKKASEIKIDSLNQDLQNIFVKLDTQAAGDIESVYKTRVQELLHVKQVYQAVKTKLLDISKTSIKKLMTQLQTGGNIRLQEGKPEDKWYKSCEDLIKSRYNQSDLASLGISGINFKRVVRIHNRFLKQKFEEKVQSLLDVASANYKKTIEYLFFGMDPSSPQQVDQIMEQGFRSAEQSKQLGLCPYTPLAHTLIASDLPRLTHYNRSKQNSQKFKKDFIKQRNIGDLTLYPPGWLFVCKVPMIKSSNDDKHPYFNPEKSPTQQLKQHPIDARESQYAIIRVKQTDPTRIKMWFMLDNSLVLPQYYVEYDYILSSENQRRVADFGETIALLQTQNDEFIGSMSPQQINRIYNSLVSQIGNYQFQNIQDCDNSNLQIQATDLDRIDLGHIKSMLINYFKYCLCRSNSYHCYNQNNNLQATQQFDISKIKVDPDAALQLKLINFSNFKIKDISFLKQFSHLQKAILSSNLITKINDIDKCPSLRILDLSRNSIESLIGLSSLKELNYLDISHNNLSNIESLKLLELNERLLEVNILFNPFKQPKEAVKYLFQQSKSVKRINYIDISQLQLKASEEKNQRWINHALIQKYLVSHKLANMEFEKLQFLHINYQKIASMRGLDKLIQLRRINLSHNRIQKIESIGNCKLLQQLNLEDNLIGSITNLQKLVFLKNLQLGKNKITKIEGISTLINLTQLSLQDNQLSVLQGFPELKGLMELYLGNNKIVDSKEVKSLKDLQKLIILDMSGNPLSKDSSYRIFTLYILKKLKVLDGISIERFEQQQAKQHFTGRLTQEILREKLDGTLTELVKVLELRNSKLKDFDDMFTNKHFPNLTELDISCNEFTTMKMLGNLPTLTILVLTHNKIDSLLCSTDINMPKGLNGCQNLYILDLSNNYLKDFNGLQFCRLGELKILKASKNQINKIDCLQNLKQLKQLDVNHNKIRQLDPFSFELKNVIKCLKIDDNLLKNFNNCQKLTKLHFLFAHSNRIQQFQDVDRLTELDHLRQIQLNGNSLCRRGGYRMTMIKKFPNLGILDGKDVSNEQKVDLQIHEAPVMPPNYMQMQMNQKPITMKMNSVDFGGVLTSNKLGFDGIPNQNMFGNQPGNKK